jgi:GNAT superfamily N-acetyltransferase
MAPTPHTSVSSTPAAVSSQRTPPPLEDKQINVRTFVPADLPAVVELFSAGMLYYAHSGGHSEGVQKIWVDYVAQSIQDDLANIEDTYFAPGGHFWVATCVEEDGREVVVGMVGLEAKPDKAYELRRMSVRAEYRRYGVGRLLVRTLEQWAKDQGLAKVWLSTGGPMVQAQKFYLSIGYTQTKVEVYSEDPLFEVVFFEKELA